MSLEGWDAAGVKRWRCNTCGKVSAWTETWSYFGSLLDAEHPGTLSTFCTDECARGSGLKLGRKALDNRPRKGRRS